MSSSKTELKVVFGAMTFGKEGVEQTRTHTVEECSRIIDIFTSHGHREVDTARYYGQGSSEEYLAALDWKGRGIIMDTKLYPIISVDPKMAAMFFKKDPAAPSPQHVPGTTLSPSDLRLGLDNSLKALNTERVDAWYLHGPDRTTPLAETLRGVNDLHKEGKFARFGISNFMSWEVAAICEICEREGWVRPTIYQGVYNALHRSVEQELLPCLRKYGISFYAFNPLAGGYLTDRYHRSDAKNAHEANSRFDPRTNQGKAYRGRYWNAAFFDALEMLRPVAKGLGLRESEVALRWIVHHSGLKKEFGDAVIIGASSGEQLEMNLKDLEGDVLPEEVLGALDQGWERTRGVSWKYFH